LVATVESLGFFPGRAGDAVLVLVDNGSTDATRTLMDSMARRLPAGIVTVVSEPERGFVPARLAGIRAATALAATRGIGEDAVLIIQADADTRYGPGYCFAMAAAAEAGEAGQLYEACNVPLNDTDDPCTRFDELANSVDKTLDPFFADPSYDVVVDDKVSAYRLGDYRRWGGLRREWDASGDEVFAETTRLFLEARLAGARRVTVEAASAVTSRRRVLEDPAVAFSTAGFPRGHRWIAGWRSRYRGATELSQFALPSTRPVLAEAVGERKRHMLGLFCVLPALVAKLMGPEHEVRVAAHLGVVEALGLADVGTARSRPSTLVEQVLSISDRHVEELMRHLA
jgi:hypothetical protein